MITVIATRYPNPYLRSYDVKHSDNGIRFTELRVTIGENQSWDKEEPKVLKAIVVLTGIEDESQIDLEVKDMNRISV